MCGWVGVPDDGEQGRKKRGERVGGPLSVLMDSAGGELEDLTGHPVKDWASGELLLRGLAVVERTGRGLGVGLNRPMGVKRSLARWHLCFDQLDPARVNHGLQDGMGRPVVVLREAQSVGNLKLTQRAGAGGKDRDDLSFGSGGGLVGRDAGHGLGGVGGCADEV